MLVYLEEQSLVHPEYGLVHPDLWKIMFSVGLGLDSLDG